MRVTGKATMSTKRPLPAHHARLAAAVAPRNAAIVQARKAFQSYQEIATRFGISVTYVPVILRKSGVRFAPYPTSSKQKPKAKPQTQNRATLHLESRVIAFCNAGLPPKQIAKRLHLPHSRISHIINRLRCHGRVGWWRDHKIDEQNTRALQKRVAA